MNVYHVLLGCPWQYDLQALHHGSEKYLRIHLDVLKGEALIFYELNGKISFQEQERSQEVTSLHTRKWKNHW